MVESASPVRNAMGDLGNRLIPSYREAVLRFETRWSAPSSKSGYGKPACFLRLSAHMTDRSKLTGNRILGLSCVTLRIALASGFLVAIADRFGFLGSYGSRNVSWGDWKHFTQYVAVLNWFLPRSLIPAVAAVETGIESLLGIWLLTGISPTLAAWSSAALLTLFAITMTTAQGIIAPISYSVFTAAGGALLLGAVSYCSRAKAKS